MSDPNVAIAIDNLATSLAIQGLGFSLLFFIICLQIGCVVKALKIKKG